MSPNGDEHDGVDFGAGSPHSSSGGDRPPPPPPPDTTETVSSEAVPPPPPPPPPPPAPGSPAQQSATGGGAGKGTKRIVIIGLAVACVIVLAGAGLAWKILGGGGPQPQDVMPASVTAFARVDADPSASQKIDLFRLSKKIPELRDLVGIDDEDDDPRKLLLEPLTEHCDVDWAADIEPWLGDRLGVGFQGSIDQILIAVQVTDEQQAREKLNPVLECLNMTPNGVAYSQGYAIIGTEQDYVDKAVKEAEDDPLSDDDQFTNDMEKIGDPGVASVWGKPAAFSDEFNLDDNEAVQDLESVPFALRATTSTIEIVGADDIGSDITGSDGPGLAELPADTVGALGISHGIDYIHEHWMDIVDGLHKFNVSFYGPLRQLERATGLRVPDDLVGVLGDHFRIAVGKGTVEATTDSRTTLRDLDLLVTATGQDAQRAADRVSEAARRGAGEGLFVDTTDDMTVLATNEDFAGELARGDTLGDRKAFQAVMGPAEQLLNGIFVDVAQIQQIAGDDIDPEFHRIAAPIGAVGLSQMDLDDGYMGLQLSVGFTDD